MNKTPGKSLRLCSSISLLETYSTAWKNSLISTSSAGLIFLKVSNVIFVLPDSIRDILAFSKLHWIASSFWVMPFWRRNSFITEPTLARKIRSVINLMVTKYQEVNRNEGCCKWQFFDLTTIEVMLTCSEYMILFKYVTSNSRKKPYLTSNEVLIPPCKSEIKSFDWFSG